MIHFTDNYMGQRAWYVQSFVYILVSDEIIHKTGVLSVSQEANSQHCQYLPFIRYSLVSMMSLHLYGWIKHVNFRQISCISAFVDK